MSQARVRLATQSNRGTQPGTAAADDAQREEYVLWTHIGSESVFFYPPGSIKEHLVTDHGIPSVDMRWEVPGCYDHHRDHRKQLSVRTGAVGNLVAVAHPHTEAA